MFKVCKIIGISKVEFLKDCPLYHLVCEIEFLVCGISEIEFYNFSGTDRVKQNKKKLTTIRKLLNL